MPEKVPSIRPQACATSCLVDKGPVGFPSAAAIRQFDLATNGHQQGYGSFRSVFN
jgi:hypothetical protein